MTTKARNLISIDEWFDPLNKDHIAAYQHLSDTGTWPPEFLPDDIFFPHSWQILLLNKLADAWVKYMTTEKFETIQ